MMLLNWMPFSSLDMFHTCCNFLFTSPTHQLVLLIWRSATGSALFFFLPPACMTCHRWLRWGRDSFAVIRYLFPWHTYLSVILLVKQIIRNARRMGQNRRRNSFQGAFSSMSPCFDLHLTHLQGVKVKFWLHACPLIFQLSHLLIRVLFLVTTRLTSWWCGVLLNILTNFLTHSFGHGGFSEKERLLRRRWLFNWWR